jgi:hypothetical protein
MLRYGGSAQPTNGPELILVRDEGGRMRPPIGLGQQSPAGFKVAAERPPRGTVKGNVGQRGE